MKTERNIFIAFILNLSFSIFEFLGGIITGSVAILSDAIHDIGDAISIGISCFLEKKSKRKPDAQYTFGYARYSVLGGLITTLILVIGSALMIFNAAYKIIAPTEINYSGMLLFAVIGVFVNLGAAFITREGDSVNQRAVNLHMLEDVLGWVVVLIGAMIMRFTDITVIDPIMSIGVSLFILINAAINLKEIFSLLLEKAPCNVDIDDLKNHINAIDGVQDVHHIHIWSMDGQNHLATMHIKTDQEPSKMKHAVREELREHSIGHVTIEIETSAEQCSAQRCHIETGETSHHGHNHHHHHHHN